ncbi:MAG: DUF3558 family protein [Mycobacteriaceae bacterium]
MAHFFGISLPAPSLPRVLSTLGLACTALLAVGCAQTVSGSPVTAALPTDKYGMPLLTFNPCTDFPAEALDQAALYLNPYGKPFHIDAEHSERACGFKSRNSNDYGFLIGVVNLSLAANKARMQDLPLNYTLTTVAGRPAAHYRIHVGSPGNGTEELGCRLDVEMSTGVIDFFLRYNTGSDPSNCLSVIQATAEALMKYVPR